MLESTEVGCGVAIGPRWWIRAALDRWALVDTAGAALLDRVDNGWRLSWADIRVGGGQVTLPSAERATELAKRVLGAADSLSDPDRAWRRLPHTHGQRIKLADLGGVLGDDATRGQAADLIGAVTWADAESLGVRS